MRETGVNGIEVWEDEGGSSTQTDSDPAFRRFVPSMGTGTPHTPRPRLRSGHLVTRVVITAPPECLLRFRSKRRFTLVFVLYRIVVLVAFGAVCLAEMRDAPFAQVAARLIAVTK